VGSGAKSAQRCRRRLGPGHAGETTHFREPRPVLVDAIGLQSVAAAIAFHARHTARQAAMLAAASGGPAPEAARELGSLGVREGAVGNPCGVTPGAISPQ
jgi:hypothetical protein